MRRNVGVCEVAAGSEHVVSLTEGTCAGGLHGCEPIDRSKYSGVFVTTVDRAGNPVTDRQVMPFPPNRIYRLAWDGARFVALGRLGFDELRLWGFDARGDLEFESLTLPLRLRENRRDVLDIQLLALAPGDYIVIYDYGGPSHGTRVARFRLPAP